MIPGECITTVSEKHTPFKGKVTVYDTPESALSRPFPRARSRRAALKGRREIIKGDKNETFKR